MSSLRLCSILRHSRQCLRRQPVAIRTLHQRSMLPYRLEEGLGEFLPAPALKTVAVDYQEGLLKQLNEEIRGTEYATMTVVDTILAAATTPAAALTFNLASLALNNHFFLDHLKPAPPPSVDENGRQIPRTHQHEISSNLKDNIVGQFGSIAQFKSTFSATALGMFSSGYVWLVTDEAGRLAVIPTFGATTLLLRARQYTGQQDHIANLNLIADDIRENDPYKDEFLKETEKSRARVNAQLEGEKATEKDLAQRDALGQLKDTLVTDRLMEDFKEKVEATFDGILSREDIDELVSEAERMASGGATVTADTMEANLNKIFLEDEARIAAENEDALNEDEDFDAEVDDVTAAITTGRPISDMTGGFNTSASPAGLYGEPPSTPTADLPLTEETGLGDVLYPLLCVSVHEHAWMAAGYGVWGKEEWLKKFWTVVDWERVSQRFEDLTHTNDARQNDL
ncbi:manganese and iron superoxide dismutase [Cylindrobasidium torrendii FP15055 ss-10]|uniref:Manganese and iron superoxide dismutase n=1 Tax=Cylindrobasidium torrendii FP15055 ss-10 TaxID=1314674 RepID=A0A0D7BRT0_9AGAR|nr:manganese and iron superoxide dismutase [Cylindrobasidium torrendii FP15055 ss-10]